VELLAQAASPAAGGDTAEIVLFWVFAVIALGAGIAVITMRNIVHGALMLVLNMLAVAGLYVTLESPFLAIIQVLVYGGAIMVLFLFVIMLLGVDRDDLLTETHLRTRVLSVAGTGLLAMALLFGFVGPYTSDASLCGPAAEGAAGPGVPCVGLEQVVQETDGGSAGFIGGVMFTRYTYPFELAAILLTVATIGATIMGRRRDPEPDDPVVVVPGAHTPPVGDRPEPATVGASSRHADTDVDTSGLLPDDSED
jgi:NADH-quinone oxidoreductase subunit J